MKAIPAKKAYRIGAAIESAAEIQGIARGSSHCSEPMGVDRGKHSQRWDAIVWKALQQAIGIVGIKVFLGFVLRADDEVAIQQAHGHRIAIAGAGAIVLQHTQGIVLRMSGMKRK